MIEMFLEDLAVIEGLRDLVLSSSLATQHISPQDLQRNTVASASPTVTRPRARITGCAAIPTPRFGYILSYGTGRRDRGLGVQGRFGIIVPTYMSLQRKVRRYVFTVLQCHGPR